MENNDDAANVTYGARAPRCQTRAILTAGQHRDLMPMVDEFVILDGAAKTRYVLDCFRAVWNGDNIEWDMPSLWPSKKDNPEFYRQKKVSCL